VRHLNSKLFSEQGSGGFPFKNLDQLANVLIIKKLQETRADNAPKSAPITFFERTKQSKAIL
jgi:hypothetical protein